MAKPVLKPKDIRKTRGDFSREEFAALLQVTSLAIYWWESGKVKPRGPARILLGLLKGRRRQEVLGWMRRMK